MQADERTDFCRYWLAACAYLARIAKLGETFESEEEQSEALSDL